MSSPSSPTSELQLFNTQTKNKQLFQPLDPQRVTLYACGPTVYNYIHIGNARPAVVFDVLFRHLQSIYPQVIFARNITDIDDKINAAALSAQQSIQAFTQQYIQAYRDDLKGLHCLPPSVEPLCTEHVTQMVQMIDILINQGHAYTAADHVLFDITTMPDYGALSNRSQDDLLAGARVEVAPYKNNASDFVLWKPSVGDTPGWDSPWGYGRPGWHIECSAMIKTHLGASIDIHGGGADLIFPHHENERAQSNCCNATELAQVWMHNGYLLMSGEKMSKSLNNFITLRSVLDDNHGEVVRAALLSAHYRAPLDWSETTLQQTKSSLDRLYQVLREVEELTPTTSQAVKQLLKPIHNALNDDLNTPQVFAELHLIAKEFFKTDSANQDQRQLLAQAVLQGGQLIGLLNDSAAQWFQGPSPDALMGTSLDDQAIQQAIDERLAARAVKDFKRSDEIRDQLLQAGIVLEDTAQGTRWQRA